MKTNGTKVLGSATKHSAGSYLRAGDKMQELDWEHSTFIEKTNQTDSTPLEHGLQIPEKFKHRVARMRGMKRRWPAPSRR